MGAGLSPRWAKRRARVVRVELTEPLETIEPAPDYPYVVLVVLLDGAVLGQLVLDADRPITPAEQWQRIAKELGWFATRRRVRAAAERVLQPERGVAAGSTPPSVSVVVCTRDRPDDLRACLVSLQALSEPDDIEIVVVDNAPTTDAAEVVCDELGIRRVLEPHPGQSRARNRGFLETSGQIVAFIDDDVAADPDWLAGLDAAFADPLVMVVCGYIGPLELETPAQFLFEVHGGFERIGDDQVADPRQISPVAAAASIGAGANMLIRRSAVAAVGGFCEFLGPGTPARSSDDKEFFYRVLRAGFRIAHDPSRRVWHRHRREPAALARIFEDYGTAEFAYTLWLLLRRGEWGVIFNWRWWLRHYASDVRRSLRGGPFALPLAIPRAELRGALAAPWRLYRSIASRRGLPALDPVPAATPVEPAETTRAEPPAVVAELPEVTVAVATYNRRDSLLETLDLLGRQSMPAERFEVVVVVDGSTDGTAEAARALALPCRIRVVEQENRGLAATRNRGAEEAAHSVVAFLDDDIRPLEDFVAAHAEAHAQPGDRIVMGPYPPRLGDLEDPWSQSLRAWWTDHFRRKGDPDHLWTFVDVLDGNMSIPTRVHNELGGFDERFRGGRRQDWELGIRVLDLGIELGWAPRAFGWHDFDTTFEKAIQNAAVEGRYDVMLARKHPRATGRLPLSRLGPTLAVRVGPVRFGRAGSWRHRLREPLAPPLMRLLAATRQRRLMRLLVAEVLLGEYAHGVGEVLSKPEYDELIADAERRLGEQPVTVDLDEPERRDRWPVAAVELAVAASGRPLARLVPMTPGEQWDAQIAINRLLETLPEATALDAVLADVRR